MASNFPSSLDTFTNPSSTDALDSVSVPHATQHSDLNDAVEALEAKVGADSSAVTSSHDYKIAQLETLTGYAAQSYTPTLTNWTASTVTGQYIQIGKLVHVFFDASGTISCSGVMQVTLPVAAANNNRLDGHHGLMLEGGVAYYPCFTAAISTTEVQIHALTQSGASVRWLLTSATSPFSWGAGDQVTILFTYEAA